MAEPAWVQSHEQSGRLKALRSGPNQFQVTLDKATRVAERQQETMWCWAACAVMAHRYFGRDHTQVEIFEAIKGRGGDTEAGLETAGMVETMIALHPTLPREEMTKRLEQIIRGKKITIQPAELVKAAVLQLTINTDVMIEELAFRKYPVVVGMAMAPDAKIGHAYLIYGVKFGAADVMLHERVADATCEGTVFEGLTRYAKWWMVDEVTMIDPATGGTETISGLEFAARVKWFIGPAHAERIIRTYADTLAVK